jgi:hypothetical protein
VADALFLTSRQTCQVYPLSPVLLPDTFSAFLHFLSSVLNDFHLSPDASHASSWSVRPPWCALVLLLPSFSLLVFLPYVSRILYYDYYHAASR